MKVFGLFTEVGEWELRVSSGLLVVGSAKKRFMKVRRPGVAQGKDYEQLTTPGRISSTIYTRPNEAKRKSRRNLDEYRINQSE